MVDLVKAFQEELRKFIHTQMSKYIYSLDRFEEEYDEEHQKWEIRIGFNEGDIRTMKIILDINPDG